MAKRIIDEEIDEDFILASMNTVALPHKPTPSLKKEASKMDTKEEKPTKIEKQTTADTSENTPEEYSVKEETSDEKNTKEFTSKGGASKEEPRRRKAKGDYESLFIRETPITGRREKTTYLRSKYYRKIQDIILCYDNPGLSVFGYIDTVLSHHFEQYGDDIKEILKRRFEDE
jgi:hypothetical protein